LNGNVSQWDTSHLTNLDEALRESVFAGDMSKWDASAVKTIVSICECTQLFCSDLSSWDVGAVKDMPFTFKGSVYAGTSPPGRRPRGPTWAICSKGA